LFWVVAGVKVSLSPQALAKTVRANLTPRGGEGREISFLYVLDFLSQVVVDDDDDDVDDDD
jgi:hypothetical protein